MIRSGDGSGLPESLAPQNRFRCTCRTRVARSRSRCGSQSSRAGQRGTSGCSSPSTWSTPAPRFSSRASGDQAAQELAGREQTPSKVVNERACPATDELANLLGRDLKILKLQLAVSSAALRQIDEREMMRIVVIVRTIRSVGPQTNKNIARFVVAPASAGLS